MALDLTQYYSGKIGAEDLDSRERDQLIEQGVPLRYNDISQGRLQDSDIRRTSSLGGTTLIPTAGGGYQAIGPDANTLPGGLKQISSGEALARWGGGRQAVDDPYGIMPQLERNAYAATQQRALQVADFLSQYLPPERIAAETKRMTGVDIGAQTTPNLLKRQQEEAGIAKTKAETGLTGAKTAETAEDVANKAQARVAAPVKEYQAMDTIMSGLNRMEDLTSKIMNNSAFNRATGPLASRLPTITQGSANLEADLHALKSQLGIQTLQEMRNASKTGGAVGNVTEGEWAILQSAIANLSSAQGPENLRRSLDEINNYARQLRERTGNAYAATYGTPPKTLPAAALNQLNQLGEGVPAKMRNGQTWVLRNGIPTRMR